mgnify:CR=1 FL=1
MPKAVVVRSTGGPEVLEHSDVPSAEPGDGGLQGRAVHVCRPLRHGTAVASKLVGDSGKVTGRLGSATGIVNIWMSNPDELADSYHRIEAKYPQLGSLYTIDSQYMTDTPKTLKQILTRIARQVDVRWETDGQTITVMPDTSTARPEVAAAASSAASSERPRARSSRSRRR